MTKEIEMLIRLNVLRDLELKIIQSKLDGQVIPEIVTLMLRELEVNYRKENE